MQLRESLPNLPTMTWIAGWDYCCERIARYTCTCMKRYICLVSATDFRARGVRSIGEHICKYRLTRLYSIRHITPPLPVQDMLQQAQYWGAFMPISSRDIIMCQGLKLVLEILLSPVNYMRDLFMNVSLQQGWHEARRPFLQWAWQ